MNKIDTTVLKNTDKLAFSGFAFNKTASETVLPASGTIAVSYTHLTLPTIYSV